MTCPGQEILLPTGPIPVGFDYLSINNLNRMLQQFRAVIGSENIPGYAFQGATNSGFWYQDGVVNLSLEGNRSVEFSATGLAIVRDGHKATITHSNTADQVYTLPDESGAIALQSNLDSNLDSYYITKWR